MAQRVKLEDLVEAARYTALVAKLAGHAEGAQTVLTTAIVEWARERGGISGAGKHAELN